MDDSSYPQYPAFGGQGEGGPVGSDDTSQSYGPAFGPFDAADAGHRPVDPGATIQQDTTVPEERRQPLSPQGTYPYPAQSAYQQGYQVRHGAQQANQTPVTPPYAQQQSAPAGYGYQQVPPTQRLQGYQGYGYQQRAHGARGTQQPPQAREPQHAHMTQQAPTQRQQTTELHREQPRTETRATPERKQHIGLKALACGLLGGALGSAGVYWALTAANPASSASASTQESAAGQTISIAAQSEDATIAEAVAAKALPSVCSVYVATMTGEGMGSGVLLDTDGNILTNYHVAGDATALSVMISGKSYDATFVGGDASSDLAVIHAELGGDPVTPIEIGDSDALVVGDWVMTIGSPFGLDQSVSAGIVSSLARNTTMSSTEGTTLYANLIQTDAMINPGNSGGALVNEQGQLVGISTLFSSDTGNFSGVGYAIPGNYAVDIARKVIAGEQVTHAYIGLSMQTVNAQNAAANRLSVNQGAYVAQVAEDGPAATAGIKEGDIITKIGDTDIISADGAILAVRSHAIGETVKVTVMRGSEEKTFDVTLSSDERLQELQQQLREQQQQQQMQQQPFTQDFDLNGNGYDEQEMLEQLYEYLYNNR